jgi:predicted Zn-dependent protease
VQWCAERPPPERAAVVPLLDDATRSVRIEAARALLDARSSPTSAARGKSFMRALAELRASLEHNADRSGALLELAGIEIALAEPGHGERAEALFRRALALEPSFAASYLNYADFLRAEQREPEAITTLEQGLEKCRDRAPLEHALGLAWVRRGDRARGLSHLERAYRAAPEALQLGYVYAVALHDAGKLPQAVQVLKALQRRAPSDRATAELLARYSSAKGSP